MNAATRADMATASASDSISQSSRKEQHSMQEVKSKSSSEATANDDLVAPTEEELGSLRRVSGKIPWTAFWVAVIELCERFSYYGTTAVFVNFIQQPLPAGSVTGAGHAGQSGALNKGQRVSTGLTTFNAFFAFVMPLFGAYVAERYWGRFKTIQMSIFVAVVGHVILIISAIPPVIIHPQGSLACFIIGIIIMGVGVGGFKANISPLIAEQCPETHMCVQITKKKWWTPFSTEGERVIMDPTVTISRVYLWFYLMINVGSLTGSISMVMAEKYVGFWVAFLMPTALLCICPFIMLGCKKNYVLTPAGGSVLVNAIKLWSLAIKKRWSWNPITFRRNVKAPAFWDDVKPSQIATRPVWMTFDDEWVDEVRRGLKACRVFLWFPIYWLAYGQMINNLTSQAATLKLHGLPNDIVANLNPIFIIILIPIMDFGVYPLCRKMNIRFTPIKRISCGFILASCAMISATVTQAYIYKTNPCGTGANKCKDADGNRLGSPISVAVQIVPYALIGFSEIMASITALEYAYTKAPTNMRSTVTAIALFMSAISSALSQALVGLAEDPLLVWNYGVVAVVAALGGIFFFLDNRKLDREEDALNNLQQSKVHQMGQVVEVTSQPENNGNLPREEKV